MLVQPRDLAIKKTKPYKVMMIAERLWQEAGRFLAKACDDIEVILTVENVEAIQTQGKNYVPDVVIIDFDIPGIQYANALDRITSFYPEALVIGIASRILPHHLIVAIQSGISGYILKSCSAAQMHRAIKDVANGQAVIELQAIREAIYELNRLHLRIGDSRGLTPHEGQVLRLLVEGLTNKQIAQRLLVSDRTVSTHLRNLFDKLRVHSRLEATITAIKSGMVKVASET